MRSDKLNLLVAYPYMKKPMIQLLADNHEQIRFVLDSGAFTAWKSGNAIELDDYCRFIERLPFKPWRYFTLDVIGDPAASMRNYETMLKRGFNPVPIFTRGEDISVLDDYYKTSDVVGLGGLVGTQGNKAFVNGLMKHVNGRKVHWLGFTNINYIKHHRPYMCDSSNYSRAARYGIMDLYCGRGRMIAPTYATFHKYYGQCREQLWADRGFDLAALSKKENWRRTKYEREIPTWSWLDFSLDCQKHLNTLLFLAITGDKSVRIALDALNHINKESSL